MTPFQLPSRIATEVAVTQIVSQDEYEIGRSLEPFAAIVWRSFGGMQKRISSRQDCRCKKQAPFRRVFFHDSVPVGMTLAVTRILSAWGMSQKQPPGDHSTPTHPDCPKAI